MTPADRWTWSAILILALLFALGVMWFAATPDSAVVDMLIWGGIAYACGLILSFAGVFIALCIFIFFADLFDVLRDDHRSTRRGAACEQQLDPLDGQPVVGAQLTERHPLDFIQRPVIDRGQVGNDRPPIRRAAHHKKAATAAVSRE